MTNIENWVGIDLSETWKQTAHDNLIDLNMQ